MHTFFTFLYTNVHKLSSYTNLTELCTVLFLIFLCFQSGYTYSGFTSISVSVMPCYHIKSMSVTVSDYNKIFVLQSVALALKFHLHFIGIWIQQLSTVQNLEPAVGSFLNDAHEKKTEFVPIYLIAKQVSQVLNKLLQKVVNSEVLKESSEFKQADGYNKSNMVRTRVCFLG